MKVSPVIPLHKMEYSNVPFRLQTIQRFAEERDVKKDDPHYHNYFELIWVTNGKGDLEVDLTKHAISNNMIFCLKPEQVHTFLIEEGTKGYVLSFTESFFNMGDHEFDWTGHANLFQFFTENHVISIQQEFETELREIILKMETESENDYPFRIQILKRYFRIFLIYLTRQLENFCQPTGQGKEIELVKTFLEMLDRNYKEKKMVSEYAVRLSITPNYLNRIVKKNTLYSAGHHIRQRIVLEAKRLATYSNTAMKEIAYNLGFSDTAHFSRFFKAECGTKFSDFKKVHPGIQQSEYLKRA
jgi:AraC family transcriptional activator of pobA